MSLLWQTEEEQRDPRYGVEEAHLFPGRSLPSHQRRSTGVVRGMAAASSSLAAGCRTRPLIVLVLLCSPAHLLFAGTSADLSALQQDLLVCKVPLWFPGPQ